MVNVYDIRRANLRTLISQQSAKHIASICGYTGPSFISQMAGKNPTRVITEETARRLEKGLALPEYWLDVERDPYGNTVKIHGNAFTKSAPPVEKPVSVPLNIIDPDRAAECTAALTTAIAETGKRLEISKITQLATLLVRETGKSGDELVEYAITLVALAS